MYKSEFHDCKFINCKIFNSNLVKMSCLGNSFKKCEFYQVELKWSYWINCMFENMTFKDSSFDFFKAQV